MRRLVKRRRVAKARVGRFGSELRRLRGVNAGRPSLSGVAVGGRRGVPPLTDQRVWSGTGAIGKAARSWPPARDASSASREMGSERRAFERRRPSSVSVVGSASHCMSNCAVLASSAEAELLLLGSRGCERSIDATGTYWWQLEAVDDGFDDANADGFEMPRQSDSPSSPSKVNMRSKMRLGELCAIIIGGVEW